MPRHPRIASILSWLILLWSVSSPAFTPPTMEQGLMAMSIVQQCMDNEVCWYANKEAIDAYNEAGLILIFPGMFGPPWDRCKFAPAGTSCQEIDFTFTGRTVISHRRSDSTWDMECVYDSRSGIGVLTYEDMDQAYTIHGIASRDMVGFPVCHGHGQGPDGPVTRSCSDISNGPIILNIYYDKAKNELPLASISPPEPLACNGSPTAPEIFTALFTDEPMFEMIPASLREAILTSYPKLELYDEKNTSEFTHREEGTLSIIFTLKP